MGRFLFRSRRDVRFLKEDAFRFQLPLVEQIPLYSKSSRLGEFGEVVQGHLCVGVDQLFHLCGGNLFGHADKVAWFGEVRLAIDLPEVFVIFFNRHNHILFCTSFLELIILDQIQVLESLNLSVELLAAVAFFIVFQINEATDLDVNAWPVGQGLCHALQFLRLCRTE